MLATATLLMVVVCACNKAQSSFEQERRSVQLALSANSEPVQEARLRQNGYASEASWQYEIQGQKRAAMKTFATRIPAGYKLVRESDSELNFARFDGHDSFYLTISFDSTKQESKVRVTLRSLPD
jgi:hypothetical protein